MISDILTESVSATDGKVQGSLEILFDQNVSAAAFTFGWKQTLEELVILPLAGVAAWIRRSSRSEDTDLEG
jgi:hypothetical protein